MSNAIRKVPLIEYTFTIAAQAAIFGAIGLIVSLFFDVTSIKFVLLALVAFSGATAIRLWRRMRALPEDRDENE